MTGNILRGFVRGLPGPGRGILGPGHKVLGFIKIPWNVQHCWPGGTWTPAEHTTRPNNHCDSNQALLRSSPHSSLSFPWCLRRSPKAPSSSRTAVLETRKSATSSPTERLHLLSFTLQHCPPYFDSALETGTKLSVTSSLGALAVQCHVAQT